MLDLFAGMLGVSTTVTAILIGLIVLQIATQVYALVDLARREAVRGGRKWVWAVAVAFGNLPGAIVYLTVGRTPDAEASGAASGTSTVGRDAARRAVDSLYGPRDRQ